MTAQLPIAAISVAALAGCPVGLPESAAVSYRCERDSDCLVGQRCQANQCTLSPIDAAVKTDLGSADQRRDDGATDGSAIDRPTSDRTTADGSPADRGASDRSLDGALADQPSAERLVDSTTPDRAAPDQASADRGNGDGASGDGAGGDGAGGDGAADDGASIDAAAADRTLDAAPPDSRPPPCFGTQPSAVCDPSDPTLVACYSFDGDSDGSGGVVDSSRYRNDGTPVSVGHIAHGTGQALGLGGSGYVTIADSPSLDVTSALTIMVWLYPDTVPASGRRGILDDNNQYGFFVYPNGYRCIAGNSITALPVVTGRWTHVACVADSNGTRLYVDGVEVAALVASNAFSTSATDPSMIGANSPTGNDNFIGAMDDLKIYNRAVGVDEICWAMQQ